MNNLTITNDILQATPGIILPINIETILEIDWSAVRDCRYIDNYDVTKEELKALLKASAYTFLNTCNLKNELCLNNLQFEEHTVSHNMQLGLYIPDFSRAPSDNELYSTFKRIFMEYFDGRRKFIGHKAIIQDRNRFNILHHHYTVIKDAMNASPQNYHLSTRGLNIHKVFKAYFLSFDCHFLGNGNIANWSFIDFVKKITLNYQIAIDSDSTQRINSLGGHKFNHYMKDINLEEYKIICQILDNADRDYDKLVRDTNLLLTNDILSPEEQLEKNRLLEKHYDFSIDPSKINQARSKYL